MRHVDSTIRTNFIEVGSAPAAEIDSGETFTVESSSFTEEHTFENMHELQLDQAVTPLTAPIMVRGAEPGDVLRVDVIDLRFKRDFGCILLLPGRGAFPDITDRLVARAVRIDDAQVHFSDSLSIPTRKMLGKVSVAPAGARVLSNRPGVFGGNMDNRDLGVGASVYLPVVVEGAHLGIGDAHAVQGDGECGISAVEVEMVSTIRVTVVREMELRTPLVRSDGYAMTMGVGSTLDEAAAQALAEMNRLLRQNLGTDAQETAMLMSLVCDVHVAQMVNPLVGVKARVPESYVQLP